MTMKTSNKINPITWLMFQGKYAIDKLFVQEEIFLMKFLVCNRKRK